MRLRDHHASAPHVLRAVFKTRKVSHGGDPIRGDES